MIWRDNPFASHQEAKRERRWLWLFILSIVLIVLILAFSTRAKATTFLPHPRGCPAMSFCGCGAANDIFGYPRRDLWPSVAWLRFPRSTPAPNTVAVRRGHVFVLKQHIAGPVWLVADYNSGKHLSRLWPRSIAGLIIVNPRG